MTARRPPLRDERMRASPLEISSYCVFYKNDSKGSAAKQDNKEI